MLVVGAIQPKKNVTLNLKKILFISLKCFFITESQIIELVHSILSSYSICCSLLLCITVPGHFINLPFHRLTILPTCHFSNYCCKLSFLWNYLFVNLSFHKLAISSTYQFINLPFCQLNVLSAFLFAKLKFCQLVI